MIYDIMTLFMAESGRMAIHHECNTNPRRKRDMAVRVIYHSKLYLSEGITGKKLDKIKKKLEKKPLLSGVFLIAVSENPSDQLNIFSARQLVQPYYEKNPPLIVGISESYDEALGMVELMVQECLRERGNCALKEYLLC